MQCLLSFRLKSKHEKLAGNKKKDRLHRIGRPSGRLRQFSSPKHMNCIGPFVATCVTTNCIISIYAQKEKHFFLISFEFFFSSHLRK
ncbi:hypothetical protein DW615_13745 [Enterococcus faecalis]|nr:hypothetical protein [Enterococcus faecalis]